MEVPSLSEANEIWNNFVDQKTRWNPENGAQRLPKVHRCEQYCWKVLAPKTTSLDG